MAPTSRGSHKVSTTSPRTSAIAPYPTSFTFDALRPEFTESWIANRPAPKGPASGKFVMSRPSEAVAASIVPFVPTLNFPRKVFVPSRVYTATLLSPWDEANRYPRAGPA
jgi:hypothetical protein